jgi:hypothetical protein
MVFSIESVEEEAARASPICPGCGKPKDVGGVVCWGCFKYRADNPYKWFRGSFLEWLKAVGSSWSMPPQPKEVANVPS